MSEENGRHSPTIYDDVDRLKIDMYYGRGPNDLPMTTRMALMEDCFEKMSRNLNKAVWLMVGTFLTSVATIVVALVLRK